MGWRTWLACGLGAAVLYTLLPSGGLARTLAITVALASITVMIIGARRNRSLVAGSWYVFAAGIASWVLGDVLYPIGLPFPSWADAFYLGAYPLLTVALFRLTRQRGPVWSGNLIDAAIIAVGLGIVYWTFLIEPIVADSSTPPLTRAVIAGYPTAGVLLCAVIIPILLRPGPRTASLWLLTAGSAVTLAGNVVYTLVPEAESRLLYAGYLVAYVLFAAAAAHPSMSRPVAGDGDSLGRSRLTVLTASTLLVPAVLLIRGDWHRWGVVAVGSMVLFVLVASRMSGYVTRVDSQARQLRHLAMHDDLTGLPNRRELEHRVTVVLAAGGGCTVIVIDLAGFRHINDRLGRAAGDQALIAVGELLRSCVRDGDLAARMGADEFAVLVRSGGTAAANRLLEALRHPVQAGEHELLLTARLGLASGGAGLTATELVRRADTARYAAKSSGTPLVVHTAELDECAEAAERLGADLRHSLDDGDFTVVYQPIVALRTGRVVAVEALVRWTHPIRGQVSPADFIPVAEDNGLIVELGEWIMRTACRQFARWRAELGDTAPQYVSVNVSARQLSEPGFPDVVAGILMDTGVPAAALLVEVTETALFGGGVAIDAVESLHRAGIRIALDDFGTGHSSLGLLRAVPVDVLKVDKSFVDEITEPGRQAVIVDALIHVSNGLGLRAVAEGVETAEQADYLRELGYDCAQGWHFGRPVAQPDFGAVALIPARTAVID
ncbi:putative diguanylate cyclase/phosphodiesterase [Actinoplanes missouriensis 431]|uniref:Putative diguanylate cyclase/phosphodiesterase n=1 Tax=Actinoplanes missouriensis (strain ATCC 14538 / DSM 43046 / CBS 188.64 / JCM 3121 / NBRC 102363 / NCIMB 12654 / NRRL B-3342 / UNCC 431) TaxID=512565 RepID=I0H786_ACTM4|nr:bifunctional diguanylate cyclase/phosphodiesterase [Actinoplanes missouriensis]BAL88873.1 putative diguanylate cyclase/phosphodiesterase [Actinoplanes missouriensis 431]